MNKKPVIALILLLLVPACDRGAKEKSIGTVNDTPILVKDFKREVAIASRRDPSRSLSQKALEEQLGAIIDRKLMIQEAVSRGLSEDERFIETIKVFWEQTLIRQLVDAKTKEWADRLDVSDDEVRRQYERMRYRVTFRLVRAASRDEAEKAAAGFSSGQKAGGFEVVGPVMVEDLQPGSSLARTFDLESGKTSFFQDRDAWAAVQIIRKEKIGVPPLSAVYSRIRTNIFEGKKERLMDGWLRELRKSAKINIDLSQLSRAANDR